MTGVYEDDEPTGRTTDVVQWTCPHVTFTGTFVVPPTWSCGCQLRPIHAAH